jgi:molecular chaperone HscB
VCAGCGAVQPLRPDADLFAVLGLPRALQVDAADLERRYHAASRAVHPDRYQTASERDQQLSLTASAAVNRAYRTLRDPVSRGRYWLELHGMRLGEGRPDVPPALAADVFETQELLEEFRAAGSGAEATKLRGDVERVRDRFAARLAGLGSDLIDGFARSAGDGAADLERLRGRLAEIAYLRTLVGDIEETLGEGLRGTNHRH